MEVENKTFTVRSAYELLVGRGAPNIWTGWRKIRRLKSQARSKVFLWFLSHDRTMSNWTHWRRRLSQTPNCSRCTEEVEDGVHAVRDCSGSNEVWISFVPPQLLHTFFSMDLKACILTNLKFKSDEGYGGRWPEVFAQVTWSVWRWRCTELLDGYKHSLAYRIEFTRTSIQEMEKAYSTGPLHQGREWCLNVLVFVRICFGPWPRLSTKKRKNFTKIYPPFRF